MMQALERERANEILKNFYEAKTAGNDPQSFDVSVAAKETSTVQSKQSTEERSKPLINISTMDNNKATDDSKNTIA